MAQILVRNLDDAVIERLKSHAAQHNRSLQAEVKTILERAVRIDAKAAWELAQRIRREFKGRRFSDSADLVREDRSR